MEIKDFKVGQIIYLKKAGNQARHLKGKPIEEYIVEATIAKIGRQYLYLEGWEFDRMKFGIGHHNLILDISDYGANYYLYSDKQQIYDELERINLLSIISHYFDYTNSTTLTLEQLKKIEAIYKEGE